MDKFTPPLSFGIFKPVGHTVVAFRTDDELQSAVSELVEQGFAASAFVHYTAAEMKAQVDDELQSVSPLASLGYEIKIIQSFRALAETGCSFLVVNAPDDERGARVAAVAQSLNAMSVQHYGRFVIEDLTEPASTAAPVYESFSRDAQSNAGVPKRR
jgi:hypothetical protein